MSIYNKFKKYFDGHPFLGSMIIIGIWITQAFKSSPDTCKIGYAAGGSVILLSIIAIGVLNHKKSR